jgi:hypothetical protein
MVSEVSKVSGVIGKGHWESVGERSFVISHWSLVAAWLHGCMIAWTHECMGDGISECWEIGAGDWCQVNNFLYIPVYQTLYWVSTVVTDQLVFAFFFLLTT